MESIKLDHSSIKTAFLEHLKISGNDRLLFTAPFGSGKSTFLNEVFEGQQANYFTLKLFPINYSVSPNEDVFELIKFDLILQLMGLYKDEVDLKEEDFSTLLSSQVYISERLKIMPIVNALLALSGKVGKSAVEIIKAFSDTIKDFKEFQEEIKIDEEKELKHFLKQIETRKGNTYEMDDVSVLVYDLIERVKGKKNENKKEGELKVESILIIDDLDRLDPEHTFRLFNIFTAHFDDLNHGNKFGFDKVIFVCDIENIWKLYRHKYGYDVDFKGYLDKFYSLHPFQFDNRKYVKEQINNFIGSIKTSGSTSGRMFSHLTKSDHKFDFFFVARWLLLSLIDSKSLNLRTLTSKREYQFPDYEVSTPNDLRRSEDFEILILFKLLKEIYSSYDAVREKLDMLNSLYNDDNLQKASEHESYDYGFITKAVNSALLPFLLPREVGFKRHFDKEDARLGYASSLQAWIHFEIDNTSRSRSDKKVFLKATTESDPSSVEVKISSYKMLLVCFDECYKMGALK
ncbi:MAG: hypothetical protein EOO46_00285 [Flavobacterium sp.]|nr:MAG: hypothetical protein EOO46_00285 [Flavobacterium sp.]